MAELIIVSTPQDRLNRLNELEEERRREEMESEEAKKNKNFAQVYSDGWTKIREFVKDKQTNAVTLYAFLAEHMDPNTGAVVASQALLAEKIGVSVATIKNVCIYLEKKNALIRINLGKGTVQAYCLNPEMVWKSFDNKKQFAAFNTKTLARTADNGDVIRKLKLMIHSDKPEPQAEFDFESDTLEIQTPPE